jgi:hypothetical protein
LAERRIPHPARRIGDRIAVSPLAKRIVLSWVATDVIWASLFIYVLKREQS